MGRKRGRSQGAKKTSGLTVWRAFQLGPQGTTRKLILGGRKRQGIEKAKDKQTGYATTEPPSALLRYTKSISESDAGKASTVGKSNAGNAIIFYGLDKTMSRNVEDEDLEHASQRCHVCTGGGVEVPSWSTKA